MFVIGTAGHIDHGKSTLIQRLTGIDPDRLAEEKARGVTIDLGFAWLRLPDGREVSIVDVPGHERFVHNMLAGVGGIDLALLVVAADDGVMPQTREHLAILDLLGIEHGLVALTKIDLVDDPGWVELVAEDIRALLADTSLAGAPIVPVSAVTGAGLDELLAAIASLLGALPPRRDLGRPRLPIDRAFIVEGFGTVVTGTLQDGHLRVGDELAVEPGGRRARVRGLQTHRKRVEGAEPGTRVAVNLAGVAREDLARGMVLTSPGWLQPTTALDVRVHAVRELAKPLRHNREVSVHVGAAETRGRLRLLDRDELAAGEEGWAQLRLAEPVAAAAGDRLVLRTPVTTVAGGLVVDAHPGRHRRRHPATIAALTSLARGSDEDRVAAALAAGPLSAAQVAERAAVDLATARRALAALAASGRAAHLSSSERWAPSTWLDRLADAAGGALRAYHRQFPMRPGMSRGELRTRLGLDARAFDDVVALLADRGVLLDARSHLRAPDFVPSLTAQQRTEADRYLAALERNPFTTEPPQPPPAEVLSFMESAGELVRCQDDTVFHATVFHRSAHRVLGLIRDHGTTTLAEVRDALGASRKYAQALLEEMDTRGLTLRRGDARVLGPRAPEFAA